MMPCSISEFSGERDPRETSEHRYSHRDRQSALASGFDTGIAIVLATVCEIKRSGIDLLVETGRNTTAILCFDKNWIPSREKYHWPVLITHARTCGLAEGKLVVPSWVTCIHHLHPILLHSR